MADPFYVTTPIYYVNDVPHIGHAYTTIAADVLARFHRLAGDDVWFLTGTDEHGQKIQESAQEKGETPQQLADRVHIRFKEMCEVLFISHTDFIRTTENRHKTAVEKFFKTVNEKGDIYQGFYEGWYCTSEEMYVTESQLDKDGKFNGKEVKKLKEESYFFKLSNYGEKLLSLYNNSFVLPHSRENEVKSFVKQGLNDLSISRTTFDWGIKVPGHFEHVIYVWFDALLNYISALGWGMKDSTNFKKFWPADVHLVGKDILRFHAVYWPAFLISVGLPPPRKIFAHGWWTVDGKKMSKSLGNVVDPFAMVKQYGADAFRYFLLREVPFGQDGNFSLKALEQRINSDLANDLGNLFSRTLGMVQKYFNDKPLPEYDKKYPDEQFESLRKKCSENFTKKIYDTELNENFDFQSILKLTWEVISQANLFIDKTKPWELAKEKSQTKKLASLLYHLLECLRIISLWIFPFMPQKAETMWKGLGLQGSPENCKNLFDASQWGQYPEDTFPQKTPTLFPRIET